MPFSGNRPSAAIRTVAKMNSYRSAGICAHSERDALCGPLGALFDSCVANCLLHVHRDMFVLNSTRRSNELESPDLHTTLGPTAWCIRIHTQAIIPSCEAKRLWMLCDDETWGGAKNWALDRNAFNVTFGPHCLITCVRLDRVRVPGWCVLAAWSTNERFRAHMRSCLRSGEPFVF